MLLSGLGWESGGLATAHVFGNFLSDFEETHEYMHGDKVAIGICTQLMLDPAVSAEKRREIVSFMAKIGLPVCFEDVDMQNVSEERLRKWCVDHTAEDSYIQNHFFEVTPEDLYYAMIAADAYGKKIKAKLRA